MIQDACVCQDDFFPTEVAHRDPEVNRISDAFAPITDGNSGETTFLFGPSGVGKTCLAQFVAERLREQVLDLETCYVNCWEDYNRYRTLYRVLDAYGSDALVAILADCVRWGLSDGAIGTDALERIADAAPGDARVSIGILRRAVREVTTAGHDRIATNPVAEAVPEARAAVRRQNVAQLTPDQQTLCETVTGHGESPRASCTTPTSAG